MVLLSTPDSSREGLNTSSVILVGASLPPKSQDADVSTGVEWDGFGLGLSMFVFGATAT